MKPLSPLVDMFHGFHVYRPLLRLSIAHRARHAFKALVLGRVHLGVKRPRPRHAKNKKPSVSLPSPRWKEWNDTVVFIFLIHLNLKGFSIYHHVWNERPYLRYGASQSSRFNHTALKWGEPVWPSWVHLMGWAEDVKLFSSRLLTLSHICHEMLIVLFL